MCRNIRPLFNFEPPATDDEIRAAALQFVRKVSGFNKPSQANALVFEGAVEAIAEVARRLVDELVTAQPPKRSQLLSQVWAPPQLSAQPVVQASIAQVPVVPVQVAWQLLPTQPRTIDVELLAFALQPPPGQSKV